HHRTTFQLAPQLPSATPILAAHHHCQPHPNFTHCPPYPPSSAPTASSHPEQSLLPHRGHTAEPSPQLSPHSHLSRHRCPPNPTVRATTNSHHPSTLTTALAPCLHLLFHSPRFTSPAPKPSPCRASKPWIEEENRIWDRFLN
ncbi:unnamed protein product, partial [Sphenostylis stenocarpa]